jgi:hypothetical protein
MFDIEKFEYIEEKHMGFYEGVYVPSCTEILGVIYPISKDISESVLENASQRGTELHDYIDTINKHFIEYNDYDFSLEASKKYALAVGIKELIGYVSLLKAWKLQPLISEQRVFLLDENGELITYGHFDLIVRAREDNALFEKDKAYLFDIKRTSTFNKPRTHLQTHIYRVASKNTIPYQLSDQTFGLWLKDDEAKIVPLNTDTEENIIATTKQAKELYELCQKKKD